MQNTSARSRVEVSALFELAMSVSAVGAHGPWNGSRWETEAAQWLRRAQLLRLLCPRGGSPSRLLLPFGGGSVDLHEDLARLASADTDDIREALCVARPENLPDGLRSGIGEPRRALALLIREVADYSNHVFSRHWPLLRSQLVATPMPKLSEPVDARLLPSAFTTDVRRLDDGEARIVVFPLSEPAAGFSVPTQFRRWEQPLADLLGARRAVMLLVLEDPASTDQVAAAMHLTEPAAAHHLKVLRRAGLVERTAPRRGSWRRTDVGTRLVRSATSTCQAG